MNPANVMRKANILAVDDQRANLVALDAVLGTEFNLVFATSGHEAISILEKREDIDLILMDLQMPGIDGFETASRIKQMESCRDIPVIFITAVYNEEPYIKQGYKVGAVDYFSKPFDPEILKVKVEIYASFRQRADFLKERARQIREAEELLAVGRRLAAVMDSVRVGTLVTDRNGRITLVNEEVFRVWRSLGMNLESGVGNCLGWWDGQGNLLNGQSGPLAKALASGVSSYGERIEVTGDDGCIKTILCSASPLLHVNGELAGAILIVEDQTERKNIAKDLERRIASLALPAST